MRRDPAGGRSDIVHVPDPNAAVPVWDAMLSADAPLVGTFHCYSENRVSNNVANLVGVRRRYNRLRVRIAVSEAAAWTGRRFYGGGDPPLPPPPHPAPAPRPPPRAAPAAPPRPPLPVLV